MDCGSSNTSNGIPSKWKDAQKSGAKTSKAAKAGSPYKQSTRAKVTSGKARGQRLLAKGERKPLVAEQQGKGDDSEEDDASDEEEEEARNDNDNDDNDDEAGDEAGDEEEHEEEREEEDEGTEKHKAAKHVIEEHNTVEEDEDEQDTEEQDEEEDQEGEGGQDEEENTEDEKEGEREKEVEGEREAEGEREVEGEKEGKGEGEKEGEGEEANDKAQEHSNTRGKDSADRDEQVEEIENERAEEERRDHDKVREGREAMKQKVAVDDQEGARRGSKVRETDDKEEEERSIGSGEEERMAGEEDGSPKERRKRPFEGSEAFGCSTPRDRPNKRSKSDAGESDDGAAMDDLPKQTVSLDTTPRPTMSSPASTTASPDTTLAIVRQTSVVLGLEDTESAVWDAAQRDVIISSLSREQQTKMVRTALSLGSGEGIKELRRFVSNARKDGTRGSESLVSDFDLVAPHPDFTVRHASSALVLRSDCLAYFSALYRRLDILESKETLFAITKRVNLAAMAQYREGLVPNGMGGNRARDANLKLFRGIFPDHLAVERPGRQSDKPSGVSRLDQAARPAKGGEGMARSTRPFRRRRCLPGSAAAVRSRQPCLEDSRQKLWSFAWSP